MIDPWREARILATVREMLDRGTLWLFEDPLFMRETLALVEPALLDHLRFEEATLQNRVLISADLVKQEADLIYRVPCITEEPAARVEDAYVLLIGEHYTNSPRDCPPRRFLRMSFTFWDQEEREQADAGIPPHLWRFSPVICVVLSFGRQTFRPSLDLCDWVRRGGEFQAYVPRWKVLLLDLAAMAREELTAEESLTAQLLAVLHDLHAPEEDFRRVVVEALEHMISLAPGQLDRFRRALWFLVQLTIQKRSREDYLELKPLILQSARAVSTELEEEVEMVSLTAADEYRKIGEERGIQIGEERGIQIGEERGIQLERNRAVRGLRSTLLQVLETRFGAVPAGVRDAVLSADLDQVNAWLLGAATCANLEDVGIAS